MATERPLRGVLLVMAAAFLFATSDVLAKHLAMLYAAPLILAVRYAVNVGLVTAVMWPRHGTTLWRTQRTGLVVIRGLCLALASTTMLLALRRMPVAETVALIFLAPMLTMLASRVLLKEPISLWGWVGATGGFLGVLLVVRPGSGLDPLGVGLSLCNASLAAAYTLLTRTLARTETTMALIFHTALVGAIVFGLAILILPFGGFPALGDLALMAGLGALATAGHLMFTSAYREAPVSTLAPVSYLHIGFAALLGWVVFQQSPDGWGFVGMATIAVAGALAAWQAGRRN